MADRKVVTPSKKEEEENVESSSTGVYNVQKIGK